MFTKRFSPTRLFTLTAVAFLGNIAISIYSIMAPLYAYTIGATPFELGLIGGAWGLIYCFAPALMGSVCDRIGTGKMSTFALLLNSIVSIAYIFSETPSHLILARIFEGLAWASLWPSLESEISTLSAGVEKGLRSYNISWSIGMTIGPILAGASAAYSGIKAPFVVSLFISVVALALNQKRSRNTDQPVQKGHIDDSEERLNDRASKVDLIIPLSSAYVYAFIMAVVTTFFPSYATSLGMNVLEVNVIMFALGVAKVIAFIYSYHILRRFDIRKILPIYIAAFSLSPLIMLSPQNRLLYYLSLISTGFFAGLLFAATIYLILTKAKHRRGRSAGIFEAIQGAGFLSGPFISGIFASTNIFAPYILCAIAGVSMLMIQSAKRIM